MGQYVYESTTFIILFLIGYTRPGIGLSVAKAFARKHFDKVAICARNAERLASEKSEIEDTAKQAGRSIEVSTFPTDLSDIASLRKTLKEIEELGPIGSVYHNAARINPTEPLTTPVKEIEEDFKVFTNFLEHSTHC